MITKIIGSNKFKLIALGILLLTLFFYQIGDYSLLDLDEPRYPQAAKEMIEKGDYIIPYFGGEYRFDKPILFYWLEILSFKFIGVSEFASRLPSALAGILLVIFSYLAGRTKNLGIISAAILMTSVEIFIMARLSVTDMVLDLCMSGALVIFFLVYKNKVGNKFLYLSSFFLALGVLCKGPVALALPGLICVMFLALNKDLLYIKNNIKDIIVSILIFFLVTSPWYIAAHISTNGAFTESFFLEHNLNRFNSVLSGHEGAFWFYIPTVFIGFLPWSIFLAPVIINSTKVAFDNSDLLKRDLVRFTLIWASVFFIFFSSASTKLINYILPIYLPLAVLTALYLQSINDNLNKDSDFKFGKLYIKLMLIVSSLIALAALIINNSESSKLCIYKLSGFINNDSAQIISVTLLIGFIISLISFIKKKRFWLAVFFLTIVTGMMQGISLILLPYANYKTDGIRGFLETVPAGAQVFTYKIDRPSVSYYAKNNPVRRAGDKRILKTLKTEKEIYIVAKSSNKKKLKLKFPNIEILDEDQVYLYARIK